MEEGPNNNEEKEVVIPLHSEMPLPATLHSAWEGISAFLDNDEFNEKQKLTAVQDAAAHLLRQTEASPTERKKILSAARQHLLLIRSMDDDATFDALAPEGSLPEDEQERDEVRAHMREGFQPHVMFLEEVIRQFSSVGEHPDKNEGGSVVPFPHPKK